MSLSSRDREKLYDAEAAKAVAAGLGNLPICNICNLPVDGVRSRWHESHDPHIPKWLGGSVTGIAHAKCNLEHAYAIDTPRFAKSVRQRQMNIGAKARKGRPMVGTRDSNIKKPFDRFARPIDRRTGREL